MHWTASSAHTHFGSRSSTWDTCGVYEKYVLCGTVREPVTAFHIIADTRNAPSRFMADAIRGRTLRESGTQQTRDQRRRETENGWMRSRTRSTGNCGSRRRPALTKTIVYHNRQSSRDVTPPTRSLDPCAPGRGTCRRDKHGTERTRDASTNHRPANKDDRGEGWKTEVLEKFSIRFLKKFMS